MVWREVKGYMIDGLFVLGGIAVGAPVILVMATLLSGGI
jgi:hypothetical protein